MANWGVFHFEYEKINRMGEHTPWKAYIAAANHNEAKEQLFKTVGEVKIAITGKTCDLHAISDNLRKTILEAGIQKPRRGRPKGSTKKNIPNDIKE